jgi:hypothetical protein
MVGGQVGYGSEIYKRTEEAFQSQVRRGVRFMWRFEQSMTNPVSLKTTQ